MQGCSNLMLFMPRKQNIATEMERKRRERTCLTCSEIGTCIRSAGLQGLAISLDTGAAQGLNSKPSDTLIPRGHPVLPEANLVGIHILTLHIRLNCCQVGSEIHYASIDYTHLCPFLFLDGRRGDFS